MLYIPQHNQATGKRMRGCDVLHLIEYVYSTTTFSESIKVAPLSVQHPARLLERVCKLELHSEGRGRSGVVALGPSIEEHS